MPRLLTFEARIDKMPGAGNPLHVRGEVEVPTGGWSGTLEKTIPQGINPTILLLEAKLVKPAGIVTQAFTTIVLAFDEKPAGQAYVEVQIRLVGDEVSVPVKETH